MVNKFIITCEIYEEIAEKILKGWQFKVWKIKAQAFLRIISKRLGKYKSLDLPTKKIFIDESDDIEYLKRQKKELESFLFSDSSKLGSYGSEEFQNLRTDRLIQKVFKKAHKYSNLIKDKAIKASLGGHDILTFFNRVGISVKWELKLDKKEQKT